MNYKQMSKDFNICLLFLFFCYLTSSAFSEEGLSNQKKQVSSKAYELLASLEASAEINNCDETISTAKLAINSHKFSEFEAAQINNILSYCYYLMGDNESAVQGYKDLLETKSLPNSFHLRTVQSLAAILVEEKRFREAAKEIEDLISSLRNPSADFFLLLANMLIMSNQESRAIHYLEQIEDLSLDPTEGFEERILLAFFYAYEKADKDELAVRYLQKLTEKYTSPEYLRHLSNMYGKMRRTSDQLAILNLLYENGALEKPNDFENLIYLSIEENNFFSAGKILQEKINNFTAWENSDKYNLLSQIWFAAHETDYAREALENAARLSPKGDHYLELARFYASEENWPACSKSAKKAIKKGLSSVALDEANLIIGHSLFKGNDLNGARKHFLEISSETTFFDQAQSWIQYINTID